jgi:hypothetical protein
MSPATCPTDLDDPEPPPSHPSQCPRSARHLQCPQQTVPTHCKSRTQYPRPEPTARASKWVLESSASRGCMRGAGDAETRAPVREVKARTGMTTSGITEGMETSGCSMTSVSLMLLRRGGEGCLEDRRMKVMGIGMRRGVRAVQGGMGRVVKGSMMRWKDVLAGSVDEIFYEFIVHRKYIFGSNSLNFCDA